MFFVKMKKINIFLLLFFIILLFSVGADVSSSSDKYITCYYQQTGNLEGIVISAGETLCDSAPNSEECYECVDWLKNKQEFNLLSQKSPHLSA